ncbi:hypothetical protein C7C56_017585, partial [Massilia glaciei]
MLGLEAGDDGFERCRLGWRGGQLIGLGLGHWGAVVDPFARRARRALGAFRTLGALRTFAALGALDGLDGRITRLARRARRTRRPG